MNIRNASTAAAATGNTELLMLEFAGSLSDELRAGAVDLPAWSQVTERVREALRDEDLGAEQLAQLLAADASLAVRVLTIANSAMVARSGTPLTDLRLAVMRIGRDKVSSAVYACALAQLRNAPSLRQKRVELAQLWHESTRVAALTRLIATRVGGVDPDEAMLTGLLHNIGKLYILARLDQHSAMWSNLRMRDTLLMSWHARVGCALTRNWQLSETLCAAIGAQDSLAISGAGAPTLSEVLVAATLAAEVHESPEEAAVELAAFTRLGLNEEGWQRLLRDALAASAAMRLMLGD